MSDKDSGLKGNEHSEGEQNQSGSVKTSFWSGPGNVNTNVSYSEVNSWAITEGDICLGSVEEMEKNNSPEEMEKREQEEQDNTPPDSDLEAGAIVGSRYRWPHATMPYEIDSALSNPSRVTAAMHHWTEKTGFKFKRRSNEADYVYFTNEGGCWSMIGKRGGKQTISIGPNCSLGNAIHEIGHAIGLYHEQSRNDRDSFVIIKWQNIIANNRHNFNQYLNAGFDIGAYDYCSIMHYPRKAFSSNGQDTVIPRRSNAECMGQRNGLSKLDIEAMRTMYPSIGSMA